MLLRLVVGLKDFLTRLEREKVPYDGRRVQGGGGVQINVRDPDGNHIHIDFFGAETEGVVFREVDPSAMNTPLSGPAQDEPAARRAAILMRRTDPAPRLPRLG